MYRVIFELAYRDGAIAQKHRLHDRRFNASYLDALDEQYSVAHPTVASAVEKANRAIESLEERLIAVGGDGLDVEFKCGRYIRDYPAEAREAFNTQTEAAGKPAEQPATVTAVHRMGTLIVEVPMTSEEEAAIDAVGAAHSYWARGKWMDDE